MKAVFHPEQRQHDPRYFLSSGAQRPNPEQPARIDALLAGAARAGLGLVEPVDHGTAPLAAIHSPRYLHFLQHIHARWQRIEGASEEVIPNIHPDNRYANYPLSAVGQTGWHVTDTSCPISQHTWNSARWSANTAVHAAQLIAQGEPYAYALCRPPGHHAFAELAGGFCYFNNTAVAAHTFTGQGQRVAIVDVDLHHGNGTQGIFYHRQDVLSVSVHADPARYYPFFWGHAHEHGEGAGRGYNLNLPIPRGSGDEIFLKALESGLQRVRQFDPDVLVIALGLDAFEGDPFAGLAVSTSGFARMAEQCAELHRPTLIVQEGGYLCPELGDNLASFLGAFLSAN